ncbi:hypothetical protein TNCT_384121 [Trichonephila clavata]|uniref:Uncharacterized protein n=1 Tax=Trichonephila clavata TaxID=2740835 RepID=A0A8X6FJC5_TRICU|nr:hypothetical protein TNCT_384121 [Trichonephila clavata]
MLCSCNCHTTHVFNPKPGYGARRALQPHVPINIYMSPCTVDVAPSFWHVVSMFLSFLPIPIAPKIICGTVERDGCWCITYCTCRNDPWKLSISIGASNFGTSQ